MSQAQHTPGIFTFLELGEVDGLGYIQDDQGRDLSQHGCLELSRDENVANGNLFAAAPELLEMLAPFIKIWARGGPTYEKEMRDYWGYDNLQKARDAIAKATGAA